MCPTVLLAAPQRGHLRFIFVSSSFHVRLGIEDISKMFRRIKVDIRAQLWSNGEAILDLVWGDWWDIVFLFFPYCVEIMVKLS